MKKEKGLLAICGTVISIIIIIASFITIIQKKNINGNNDKNIKSSIAYLHKEYIKSSESINIVDEFKYDNEKVVLFNCNEYKGIAKFYLDDRGNYKINMVETLDNNLDRQFSR